MAVLSSSARCWVPLVAALLVVGCSAYDDGLLPSRPGGTGGGGTSGAGTGGGGTGGTCTPISDVELTCDAVDDDCDDDLNNGAAATSCANEILNATATCSTGGRCLLAECFRGFYNCDGLPNNGCETCTRCGMPCLADEDAGNDAGSDDASMMSLPDGAVADAATDAATDAGTMCAPTNGGVERCDGIDNDCDGTVDQASTCPTDCTGHTGSTGVYARCAPRTWGAARGVCSGATLGMRLVRIETVEENAAVHALAGTSAVWIGATDSDSLSVEGSWEWADGTQFWMGAQATMGGVAVGGAYVNWATDSAGQPDDAGGGEDCAEMTVNGVWNDIRCDSSRMFICEL